jgi:hypothetical protein
MVRTLTRNLARFDTAASEVGEMTALPTMEARTADAAASYGRAIEDLRQLR